MQAPALDSPPVQEESRNTEPALFEDACEDPFRSALQQTVHSTSQTQSSDPFVEPQEEVDPFVAALSQVAAVHPTQAPTHVAPADEMMHDPFASEQQAEVDPFAAAIAQPVTPMPDSTHLNTSATIPEAVVEPRETLAKPAVEMPAFRPSPSRLPSFNPKIPPASTAGFPSFSPAKAASAPTPTFQPSFSPSRGTVAQPPVNPLGSGVVKPSIFQPAPPPTSNPVAPPPKATVVMPPYEFALFLTYPLSVVVQRLMFLPLQFYPHQELDLQRQFLRFNLRPQTHFHLQLEALLHLWLVCRLTFPAHP